MCGLWMPLGPLLRGPPQPATYRIKRCWASKFEVPNVARNENVVSAYLREKCIDLY